jgi:hypothetical protein
VGDDGDNASSEVPELVRDLIEQLERIRPVLSAGKSLSAGDFHEVRPLVVEIMCNKSDLIKFLPDNMLELVDQIFNTESPEDPPLEHVRLEDLDPLERGMVEGVPTNKLAWLQLDLASPSDQLAYMTLKKAHTAWTYVNPDMFGRLRIFAFTTDINEPLSGVEGRVFATVTRPDGSSAERLIQRNQFIEIKDLCENGFVNFSAGTHDAAQKRAMRLETLLKELRIEVTSEVNLRRPVLRKKADFSIHWVKGTPDEEKTRRRLFRELFLDQRREGLRNSPITKAAREWGAGQKDPS